MTNHARVILDYASAHLRLMSMKDPANFPIGPVEEACRRIRGYDLGDMVNLVAAVFIVGVVVGVVIGPWLGL